MRYLKTRQINWNSDLVWLLASPLRCLFSFLKTFVHLHFWVQRDIHIYPRTFKPVECFFSRFEGAINKNGTKMSAQVWLLSIKKGLWSVRQINIISTICSRSSALGRLLTGAPTATKACDSSVKLKGLPLEATVRRWFRSSCYCAFWLDKWKHKKGQIFF